MIEILESIGEERIFSFIQNELGGWPLLNNESISTNISTLDKLVSLRMIGIRPLFELSVMSNPKKPNNFMLRVNYSINKSFLKLCH